MLLLHLQQVFVGVPQALFIGFIAAIVSNVVAEFLKSKTKLDDPLDVFCMSRYWWYDRYVINRCIRK
ncbi:MAG: hypothetical protein WDO16_17220 [Bacteroidota bacterium]